MEFTGSNFSEVYQRMCRALLEEGTESNPRAMPIRELLGVSMRLSNPRTRMLDVPKKKLPASFAIGEWLWTIEAREDLDFIRYYAPSYGRFSDDGVMLNGAYGPRIVPELEKIVGLLKQDVDSRRALVPIYAQRDVAKDSRDIPCTTTLQSASRVRANSISGRHSLTLSRGSAAMACLSFSSRSTVSWKWGIVSYRVWAG